MTSAVNPNDIYTDNSSLMALKRVASKDSSAALEKTAEQFESLFIHMMVKSMRSTTSGEGIFDSEQSQFYQQMFDQQISVDMARKRQVGIADILISQLGGQQAKDPQAAIQDETDSKLDYDRLRLQRPNSPVAIEAFAPLERVSQESIKSFESSKDFVEKLMPMAEKYAAELGVEAKVLLAQSALETGWGQHMVRFTNDVPTYNLFNIKADSRWDGPKAVVPTLEYEKGKSVRQYAAFRSYPTFEASFKDYVDFIKSGQRYQTALENAADSLAYVNALHQAGYATDPQYANKINKIMTGEIFNQATQKIKSSTEGPII